MIAFTNSITTYCLYIPSVSNRRLFLINLNINFAIYLDIASIYIHSKIYVSRKDKTSAI
jgi:hypothetical protein